jgi:RHS repeat-associated protein
VDAPPDATVPLPPDATVVQQPTTGPSTFADSTSFLYSGPSALQSGVASGAIVAQRAAVIHGRVLAAGGAPIGGVVATIAGHAEYGQMSSRADGSFDLAVNGGGALVVRLRHAGYVAADRQVDVPWQDYAVVPDVVLVALDGNVTTIVGGAATAQLASGSVVIDSDGTRQARLGFAPGTTAVLRLADGTRMPLPSLQVRATEVTVGPDGPAQMPAVLPATSGYTYAVELSADEAVVAEGATVEFSRPVALYVDNFLGFPVGAHVPVGFYDRLRSVWVPSDDGRVLQVLASGIDSDGDGVADDPATLALLGIDAAEAAHLGQLYAAGATLWRTQVGHFTPWDMNWPFGPPNGAVPPPNLPPRNGRVDDPKRRCGSIISVENQAVGERVPLFGTQLALHYEGNTAPATRALYALDIPVTGSTLPPELLSERLAIQVAGRRFDVELPPVADQVYVFDWDGIDVFGRRVLGPQRVVVEIDYEYPAVYTAPGTYLRGFGEYGDAPFEISTRNTMVFRRFWDTTAYPTLGVFDARSVGLGGWILNVHHSYDPSGRVLFRGDGTVASNRGLRMQPIRIAGQGNNQQGYSGDGGPALAALLADPRAVAVAPDASYVFADRLRVRRVGGDRNIETVAGDGTPCSPGGRCGDGGPATQAQVNAYDVALAPDGTMYIAETTNKVRRVDPAGTITTFAGTGQACVGNVSLCGDNGPATSALLGYIAGIALGPDGSLYVLEGVGRIRRIGPDGTIATIAGTGIEGFAGDGGPAIRAQFFQPSRITVGPDGALYVVDQGNFRLRRMTPDGLISTVAGNGNLPGPPLADVGNPAVQASLAFDGGIVVEANGSIDIGANGLALRINPLGILTSLTTDQTLVALPAGFAISPRGELLIADPSAEQIVALGPPYPGFAGEQEIVVPSSDGTQAFVFDPAGRHLRTIDTLDGTVLYQFSYNGAGQLAAVTLADGGVVAIAHDSDGHPTAVTTPSGAVTALAVDEGGFLDRIDSPAGTYVMTSDASGRLLTFAAPNGEVSRMSYEADGRLVSDADADGVSTTLASAGTATDERATATSTLGRVETDSVTALASGDVVRTTTYASGLAVTRTIDPVGVVTDTYPSGMLVTTSTAADPRWGALVPYAADVLVRDGTAKVHTATAETVTLTDPANPLALARLVRVVTVNGRAETTTYDLGLGTATTVSAAGRTQTLGLDALQRVASVANDALAPVLFGYDASGQLTSWSWSSRAFSMSRSADAITLGDPLGRVTALDGFDAAGHLLGWTLPGGRRVTRTVDAEGHATSLTTPNGATTGFAYTVTGRLSSVTLPTVGADSVTTYGYDGDGALTSISSPGGAILIAYDSAGRVAGSTTPDATIALAYSPATGLLESAATADEILDFSYDGAHLIQTSYGGDVQGTVTRTYDAQLRPASFQIDAEMPVYLALDADDLPTSVGLVTIERATGSTLVSGTQVLGLSTTYTRDAFGAPAGWTSSVLGSAVYAATQSFDGLGRVTTRSEMVNGVAHDLTFSYDDAGHLVEVDEDGTVTERYTYDLGGNRLTHLAAGSTVTAVYDARDRLVTDGSIRYSFTDDGRLAARTGGGKTSTYHYDLLGNLRDATLADARSVTYVIDAANRRVGKKVDGVLVQGFLYGGQSIGPLAELDGAQQVRSLFVYGSRANVPDYMVRDGTTYAILSDPLGSPRLIVDALSGSVAQEVDYDAYGRVTMDTSPGFQPFGFAGGLYDADTGLLRFGARDYDPETGRFTTPDAVDLGTSFNRFAYVDGDPVNRVDWLGNRPSSPNPANADKIQQVIDLVAADPRMQDILDTVIPTSVTGTFSGDVRNAGMVTCDMISHISKLLGDRNYCDPSTPYAAKDVCTGISDLAVAIITAAGLDDLSLKKAEAISREGFLGTAHTAVQLTFSDDSTVVVDWHQTLDPQHPAVQSVSDWSGRK